MIASQSTIDDVNLIFICFNPVSTNLPYVEFANNLYRFFSTVVLDFARFSTYSHIQIWTEPVWIEWDDEYVWLDNPVEYPIEVMNNEPDISVLEQDHKWASVYSILSLCLRYHSSQHSSWYHLNTCPLSVEGRMGDHWIYHGVIWVLRYHIQWSIHSYRIFWATSPICSDSISLFL